MAQTDYIRPISDLELGHTPNTGRTGFNLLNEIVSDEDSTYISASGSNESTTQVSKFKLSGQIGQQRRIVDAKAIVVAKASSSSNAQTYPRTIQVEVGNSKSSNTISQTEYSEFEYEISPEDISYDGNNVSVDLTLTTTIQTMKGTVTFNITQIYIELVHKLNVKHLVSIQDRGSGTHDGGDGEHWDEDDVSFQLTAPPGIDIHYLLINDEEDHKDELQRSPEITPEYNVVATASGASYGFAESNGYWTSQNKAQNSSAAVCQVNFNMAFNGQVEFTFINYAQARSDYGLIGAVDQTLRTTNTADTGVAWTGYSSNSANEQKTTISIPSGQHFIQLKYLKNNRTNQNNDDFRWKITSLKFTEEQPIKYSYTIQSIQEPKDIKIIYSDYWSKYKVKSNGTWNKVRLAFVKKNGHWVETSESQINGISTGDTIGPPYK